MDQSPDSSYRLHYGNSTASEQQHIPWTTLQEERRDSMRSSYRSDSIFMSGSFLSEEQAYLPERIQDLIKNDEGLSERDREIIQYLALRKFHM